MNLTWAPKDNKDRLMKKKDNSSEIKAWEFERC